MELKSIKINNPDELNIIIGQSHFIKTAEDIYEAMVNTVPNVKFGVAFCEASVNRLVRIEGNDDDLWKYGLFYYNKNDPAIFVKKRIGIGYTFNHARKSVLVFYVVLLGIIVVSAVFGL